jgi:folylpolyglutamate synthase/dihydropteroate synthase
MRHLSAIILFGLLCVLPSCKFFNKKENAKAMASLLAQKDSIRVADSLRNVHEQLLAQENAKLEEARKAEELLALNSKYNIIVGSFKTPEYAKLLAQEYSKKGYKPTIIKMQGSTFELVSAEGYASLSKAFASLKEFQNSIEFNAWIYVKK